MSRPRRSPFKKFITTVIVIVAVLGVAFLILRSRWVHEPARTPQEAFLYGTIGTEVVPLSVFEVLPDMFPDQFQPDGKDAGDWVDQFGFIRGTPGVNEGLPFGFAVSNRLPRTGSPSPVRFVGFSCSACHTSIIRRNESDKGVLVYGMGSLSIDFFGWADALRTSILDEKRLTMESIESAYRAKFGKSMAVADKITARFWLSGIRDALKQTLPKYDGPFGGKDLRNSYLMPIGPGRSQAFKSLVQIALDRPGATDHAYSKLPVIYEQRSKERAQFDGAAKNFVLRSALAALGSGASLKTLALPEVVDNIKKASDYTLDLHGPKWTDVFPDLPIDSEKAQRGQAVYTQYCSECHGYPKQGGGWINGKRDGEIIPVAQIGTDPERVSFRYYNIIGKAIYDFFPDNHPLNPQGDDLRQEGAIGYINAPIQSAFTRAPFLHNGSVPTLAELINLKPRRDTFYRGRSFYDPVDVGIAAPQSPERRLYYLFDTSRQGDSNKGHNYPWSYQGPGWNESALQDLLEYLKTL